MGGETAQGHGWGRAAAGKIIGWRIDGLVRVHKIVKLVEIEMSG